MYAVGNKEDIAVEFYLHLRNDKSECSWRDWYSAMVCPCHNSLADVHC